ncbi:MAG: hypothetical protein JW934_18110 [Anaerolineae bacterium]|nr:hypothetical protein [Anaerolineae bacterium]
MKKHLFFAVLFACLLLGCAIPSFKPATTPAPALEATVTLVPTSTPTAIPTSTPTTTPTSTPPAAPTKTAAEVQDLDLSGVRILPGDLPPGFMVFDLTTIGVDPAMFEQQGYKAENPTSFLSLFPAEFTISLIVRAQNDADRETIDLLLDDPDKVLDMIGSQIGQIKEKQVMEDMPEIGEKAGGLSVVLARGGANPIPIDNLRADIVVFRREMVLGVCLSIYPDGQKPRAPAVDLALLLDERLQAALEQQ